MIGLFLLYFIGKAYYDLAGLHNKGQWLYAILGIVSYYASAFIGGILIGIFAEIFMTGSLDDTSDIVWGLIALPFGILGCWGFYRILKSRWENSPKFSVHSDDVLDANLADPNSPAHNS